jgi:hypothetical protein
MDECAVWEKCLTTNETSSLASLVICELTGAIETVGILKTATMIASIIVFLLCSIGEMVFLFYGCSKLEDKWFAGTNHASDEMWRFCSYFVGFCLLIGYSEEIISWTRLTLESIYYK